MDNYQKKLISDGSICFWIFGQEKQKVSDNGFNKEVGSVTVEQASDITIIEYPMVILVGDNNPIGSVQIKKNNAWLSVSLGNVSKTFIEYGISEKRLLENKGYLINLNFDDKIEAMKISFKNGLADDLIIPVLFKDADKEAYYKKIQIKNREEMVLKAHVIVKTGTSIINAFFKPVSEDCSYSTVDLYLKDGENKQFVGEFKSAEGFAYISITGLANALFFVVLKEHNSKGNVIFESDPIEANVSTPSYIRCSGGR